MTAVAVAFDGVRLHTMGDADGITGVSSLGGGPGAGLEPDFVYQGAEAVSRRIGTTLAGFAIDTSGVGGSANMTSADRRLWLAKVIATNPSALLTNGSPSYEVRVGPSSAAYIVVDVRGSDDYPKKGGWLTIPIEAQIAALQSENVGSPTFTAIDYFAVRADFNAASRAENVAVDAIDVGIGLVLTGGTAPDPAGKLEDFIDADEGTQANSWGFWNDNEGVYFARGLHVIGRNAAGTATATRLLQAQRVVVFEDGPFAAGAAGFLIDSSLASQDYSITNLIVFSRGSGGRAYFDSSLVDAGADTVELEEGRFVTGDAVIYGDDVATANIGLTEGTRYWLNQVGPTEYSVHTGRRAAFADTGRVALTAQSGTTRYRGYFDKDNDSRADFEGLGENATQFLLDAGQFQGHRQIILPGISTLQDYNVSQTGFLDQNGATITGLTAVEPDTLEGVGFADIDDLSALSGSSFESAGLGHAVRALTTGIANVSAVDYQGYFVGGGPSTYQFDNTTDVDAGTDRITLPTGHGFTTGDPVVYSRELTANTALAGLTQDQVYYVNVVGDTMKLFNDPLQAIEDTVNFIALTPGTGNETHALYSANCAFFNDSGGLITYNVTDGGSSPTVRNGLDASTVVNQAVTILVTVVDILNQPLQGIRVAVVAEESAGTITEEDEILNALSDVNGEVTTSINYEAAFGTGLAVTVRGRSSSPPATRYVNVLSPQQITPSGLITTIQMREDDVADDTN